MKKTQVTEESLIKAYNEGCEDVKEVLRNLYPKFEFKEDKYFDLSKLNPELCGYKIFTDESSKNAGFANNEFIQIRNSCRGEYGNKSFFLSSIYNWEIKRDNQGKLCLIPTRK